MASPSSLQSSISGKPVAFFYHIRYLQSVFLEPGRDRRCHALLGCACSLFRSKRWLVCTESREWLQSLWNRSTQPRWYQTIESLTLGLRFGHGHSVFCDGYTCSGECIKDLAQLTIDGTLNIHAPHPFYPCAQTWPDAVAHLLHEL